MVRLRRLVPWLLACGWLLHPSSPATGQEPAATPPAEGAAPPAPADADRRADPEPSRGRRPGGGDPRPGSPAPDEVLELRILELQRAIWTEIGSVESRLERIKERLASIGGLRPRALHFEEEIPRGVPLEEVRLRGPGAPASGPPPGADVSRAPGDDVVFFLSTADERRHAQLLRRQDALLRRWRRPVHPTDPAPGDPTDPAPDPGSDARRPAAGTRERESLLADLRGVLAEILDLRERARERQIADLRREISDIERAIESRRDETERARLVESRLRDLLGAWESPR